MSACCDKGTCAECVALRATLAENERAYAALHAMAAPANTPASTGRLLRWETRDELGEITNTFTTWDPPSVMLAWKGLSMLGLWRSVDARACHIAITTRRVGLITDESLLLYIVSIALYDQAHAVMRECVELANAGLRDPKASPPPPRVSPPTHRALSADGSPTNVVLVGDLAPHVRETLSGAGIVVLE